MTDNPDRNPAGDAWDDHWDDYAAASRVSPAQEYRRDLVRRLVEALPGSAPQRVLDIGSGTGEFAELAARRWPTAEFLGLEMSDSGIALSRHRVPSATFLARNLITNEQDVERPGWATHAVCSEVLEHVDEPVTLLRNARAWLAPGCWVVITVPGGPMSAFDRHIGHRRHFTTDDLAAVATEAGLEVHRVLRAGFPFFNLYRTVVISRGKRLIDDARGTAQATAGGRAAHAAMAMFQPLFRLNVDNSRYGWQTVCVAREPSS